jgi:hypothetical protein
VGGLGSGRWGGRPTIERTSALVLDVNALMTPIMRSLHQHGLSLPDGQPVRLESRTWSWQRPDEPHPLAEVRISLSLGDGHAEACLNYDIDHPGGRTGPQEERVSLIATPCRFGGVRWWWLCPATGRRCSKLYLPNGGLRFLSRGRGAYELDYMSHRGPVVTRLLRRSHRLRKKLDLADSSADASPPQKPKGMHWKTYLRILSTVAATEADLDRELRKLMVRPSR